VTYDPAEREIDKQTVSATRRGDGEAFVRMLKDDALQDAAIKAYQALRSFRGTARIVVDARSGYPLAVEHWTSDDEVSGTRIENMRVGGAVPRNRFTLHVDVQDKLLPMSERCRRMTLRQAAALGRRADNPPGSDDPFDEDSAALSESTRVRLATGSLRGETASLVLGLTDWPHLYVTTGADHRVSVSVAGDLTRKELTRIAGSLRTIGE